LSLEEDIKRHCHEGETVGFEQKHALCHSFAIRRQGAPFSEV
jgi:hypothetical protein